MTESSGQMAARLAALEARVTALETAQPYVAGGIVDLRDEVKFIRRTALTTLISILSALLLAVCGVTLNWLARS